MAYSTLNLGLTLTIPTNGTRNWGSTMLQTTWTKISQHGHSGSGDGNPIGTNGIANYSITKDKIKKDAGLFHYTTLLAPSGTAQTIDFANGSTQKMDLDAASGDVELTLSNAVAGVTYKLFTIQGAVARDITWPISVKWPQGQKPILTQTENGVDIVHLYYDGVNFYGEWNNDFQ